MKLIVFALCAAALISCKKEKRPDPVITECTERCNYFHDFVNHHWVQTGDFQDSSSYALSHIDAIPLATTDISEMDSCDMDNEWIINPNGTSYALNHIKCSPADADTFALPNWKFSNDRKELILIDASRFYIQSITPSEMKLYYFSTSIATGQDTIRYANVWVFKSI